jgi:hypothetical protein
MTVALYCRGWILLEKVGAVLPFQTEHKHPVPVHHPNPLFIWMWGMIDVLPITGEITFMT